MRYRCPKCYSSFIRNGMNETMLTHMCANCGYEMEEDTSSFKPLLHISLPVPIGMRRDHAEVVQNTIRGFKERLSERFEIIVSPANVMKLDTEGPICNITIDYNTDINEAVKKLTEFAEKYCE